MGWGDCVMGVFCLCCGQEYENDQDLDNCGECGSYNFIDKNSL